MTSKDVEKICKDCGGAKSLSEFYKHGQMADGHLNKCKTCCKEQATENRLKNIDAVQEYDRMRGRSLERKLLNASNRHRYKDRHTEYNRQWRSRNPEKYAAHTALNNAIRDGKISKGFCQSCGVSDVEAHHDDYSKPLDVVWLCVEHHGLTRRIEIPLENTSPI